MNRAERWEAIILDRPDGTLAAGREAGIAIDPVAIASAYVTFAVNFAVHGDGIPPDQFAEYLHLVAVSVEDGGPLPVLVSLPVRNRKD